jgi:hypothetical protein
MSRTMHDHPIGLTIHDPFLTGEQIFLQQNPSIGLRQYLGVVSEMPYLLEQVTDPKARSGPTRTLRAGLMSLGYVAVTVSTDICEDRITTNPDGRPSFAGIGPCADEV